MKKSAKIALITCGCLAAVTVLPYGIWRLTHRPKMELGASEKFTKAELLLAVETVAVHLAKDGLYIDDIVYDEAVADRMLDSFSKVTDKENSVWFTADVCVDWMAALFLHGDNAAAIGGNADFGWTLTQQEDGTWEIVKGCCGYA
ncbi:MAG: hypothetical protein IJC75_05025 [Oscillospiraceae bacterium]|nr:hypothetical protein [Oscillospiraceae bacterium]